MEPTSLAFIGLGVMGYPMAGHLHRAGHKVRVYNRTAAKAEKFVAEFPGAEGFSTPAETANGAEFVFSCVGNDDDLRAVTIGDGGAFAGMSAGAIFVDHTTASAEVARELHAAAAERGFGFIDAPISGGQAGAEKGALTVMCGGDPSSFAKAEPVIACYARACRLMGPPGAGQLTKMVNQIAIAGLIQSLAEALHFARRRGPRTRERRRSPQERRGAIVADGKSHENNARRASSTSASPSNGCARTLRSASPRRGATARGCRSRRSSTSSTPRSRRWAGGAGTRRASSPGLSDRADLWLNLKIS